MEFKTLLYANENGIGIITLNRPKIMNALDDTFFIALKAAKDAINRGINVDLSSGLDYEKKTFALLFSTEDQKEGMKAFLEKRKPNYLGH